MLGAVRQHQPNPVPRLDAQPAQSLGGPTHLVSQLDVGRFRAEEVKCHLLAKTRCAGSQHLDQRLWRNLDLGRYARSVARQPGTPAEGAAVLFLFPGACGVQVHVISQVEPTATDEQIGRSQTSTRRSPTSQRDAF